MQTLLKVEWWLDTATKNSSFYFTCVGQPTTTTVALYRDVSIHRLFILAFWNLWQSMHMLVLEPNFT